MSSLSFEHTAIETNDLQSTIEFYTNVLDFKLITVRPSLIWPGEGWELAFLKREDLILEVLAPSKKTFNSDLILSSRVNHLAFAVDSVQDILNKAVMLKARVVNICYNENNKAVQAFVQPLDGSLLEFFEKHKNIS